MSVVLVFSMDLESVIKIYFNDYLISSILYFIFFKKCKQCYFNNYIYFGGSAVPLT